MAHHPQQLVIAIRLKQQQRIGRMGRLQGQPTTAAHQAFDGEPITQTRHHHMTRPGGQAAVEQQQITMPNAGALHRWAADPQQQRRGWITHQPSRQINTPRHGRPTNPF